MLKMGAWISLTCVGKIHDMSAGHSSTEKKTKKLIFRKLLGLIASKNQIVLMKHQASSNFDQEKSHYRNGEKIWHHPNTGYETAAACENCHILFLSPATILQQPNALTKRLFLKL